MKENYIFWKNVWDKKGNSDSDDLLYLDGYEHLDIKFNSWSIASKIKKAMLIKETDMVLEVGCGAGFLGKEFSKFCMYQGVDYSKGLINKHKNWFKNSVFECEANNLFYPDNSFDKVFCFGVFQYFPDKDYSRRVVSEMMRVAKECVFIGDLKTCSNNDKHLSYEFGEVESWYSNVGFYRGGCLYDGKIKERYNLLAYCNKEF